MNLLVFAGLSDKKLQSKLRPVVSMEKVENAYLVRNSSLSLQKIHSLTPPSSLNILFLRELIKLLLGAYVVFFKEVDFILGIYFRPHGLFACILGKVFGKPVIPVFIGNDVDFVEKHPLLFKNLLKTSHRIGVRGTRSKKRIREMENPDSQLFIHHNIFHLPEIESFSSSKTVDVLCIADFSRVKRMDVFLKIIQKIKEKKPGIKAVMLGGGRKRKFYEKMKNQLNLQSNVSFKGRVEDVESYLSQSRIFLLTSEAEGLPMSVIEAMAFGLPCVVPLVGDIPDVVEEGYNGYLINPLDTNGFVSKSLKLLEDQNLYQKMSQNALLTVKKKAPDFSLQSIKITWEQVLD